MINELLQEIDDLSARAGIEGSRSGFRDTYKEENERIERYLGEFTMRQGVLLAVASLITALPILVEITVSHFLIWSFPLLFAAVACYIMSSKRINFVSKDTPRLLDSKLANNLLKKNYYRAMVFHKAVDVLIVMFFASFVTNYYLLLLTTLDSLIVGLISLILVLLLGWARYWYISDVNKTTLNNTHSVPGVQYEDMDEVVDEDPRYLSAPCPVPEDEK